MLAVQTGFIAERDHARIATSGALTIGVKAVPPIPPRDEMVKRRALHLRAAELAGARLFGHFAELAGEVDHALLVDVLDHRHDQPVGRVDRDADMPIATHDQRRWRQDLKPR